MGLLESSAGLEQKLAHSERTTQAAQPLFAFQEILLYRLPVKRLHSRDDLMVVPVVRVERDVEQSPLDGVRPALDGGVGWRHNGRTDAHERLGAEFLLFREPESDGDDQRGFLRKEEDAGGSRAQRREARFRVRAAFGEDQHATAALQLHRKPLERASVPLFALGEASRSSSPLLTTGTQPRRSRTVL